MFGDAYQKVDGSAILLYGIFEFVEQNSVSVFISLALFARCRSACRA